MMGTAKQTNLSRWHVRKEAKVRVRQVHVALQHYGVSSLTLRNFTTSTLTN